jgi:hypothetical protein
LLPGVVLLTLIAGSSLGCIGVTNWLIWGWRGIPVPAEYDQLEEKRVAIVCVTRSSSFEPGGTTGKIARRVAQLMNEKIKGIDVVDMEEVADWIDRNDWNRMDYRVIGRGVKSDVVLAIEFESLSFQDNSSTVKGRADFKVKVYDMASGNVVFSREVPEHVFPSQGPASVSPRKFEQIYTERLATHIAQYFYDHDFTEDFGNDTLAAGD